MSYRPLGDKILIQPDHPESVTKGGLLYAFQKTPNTGKVLAVSPDISTEVTVGDLVHYSPNHREELEDGTILISEEEINLIL